MRRRRLVRGLIVATLLATSTASIFAAVAFGNELALRDRVAVSSRFGPTDIDRDPPVCDGAMGIGPAARLNVHIDGTLDGRWIGSADITGVRAKADVRWQAYVATTRVLGLAGAAEIGSDAWLREPSGTWDRVTPAEVGDVALDLTAFKIALSPEARAAASTLGVGLIEGAPSRQCRTAIDGPTFRAAFPQVAWIVGDADLAHWRGQIDYWVFVDGQIGRIAGSVSGDATEIREGALQSTLRVDLTATDRDTDIRITAPTP
jgi:hypothetical protein